MSIWKKFDDKRDEFFQDYDYELTPEDFAKWENEIGEKLDKEMENREGVSFPSWMMN